MKRRDLLTSFPFTGYSLLVSAGGGSAAPAPDPHDFQTIAPVTPRKGVLAQEPHMTVVDLHTDVLVAGGGLAGVCAALAAARNGARVVLVQDRSRLGGNSSSEVKMHVVGANSHKSRPGWRESGIVEELRLDDAVNNPQRCWELWDLLLYSKVMSEPNITLLLETTVYSADVGESKIRRVLARCDKSEHLYRIRAEVYCDCTGDSRLGLESGADYRTGREPRSQYGESLAPEQKDNETLGSSILFTSRLYRKPMPFQPPSWARKVSREQLKMRPTESWEYGYWWIEWGGNLDTIRDNERIRFELLSIVMGVWDYIKNSGDHPTSEYWALDWVGMMPGRRGSRRLLGEHVLTQMDLEKGTFEDAVAIGGWPLDDHPPGGFDRADLPPNTVLRTAEVYDIPLRALYSRNVANLMMAGRNISATHAAFTSTRVMATCAVIGQAVGTAAAQCAEQGVTPKELAASKSQISKLQQTLLRQDQTIKSVQNSDARDVARRAAVTASAVAGTGTPDKILDGHLRDIPDGKGNRVGVHHWAAPIGDGQSPWIELKWTRPERVSEIQITFDTGFERELTLTSSDSITRGIVRAPQPETIRDYVIHGVRATGEEVRLAQMKGNHQRLVRHRFPPAELQSLRIEVQATNGLEQARIFEVRCYA